MSKKTRIHPQSTLLEDTSTATALAVAEFEHTLKLIDCTYTLKLLVTRIPSYAINERSKFVAVIAMLEKAIEATKVEERAFNQKQIDDYTFGTGH